MLYQEDENNIIGEYIIFCKVYNAQRKKCGQTKEAIEETIRICKDRNVLREYLENRQKEVVDIMMTLYDDEEILEMYTNDIEKRRDRKAVERMIKVGKLSLEEIAEYFPSLSLDEIKEIEAEVMQTV